MRHKHVQEGDSPPDNSYGEERIERKVENDDHVWHDMVHGGQSRQM